jgi:hypothetical protein
MLNPQVSDYITFPSDRPKLIVLVDTEEEFDWNERFSPSNVSVDSIRSIYRAQNIFDKFNVRPVYLVDYPVAATFDGYKPLQEIFSDKRCLIGAHLHPWVNPPFEEVVNQRNSFAGNLPYDLELRKISTLTECLEERFGEKIKIYKAGRYGVGPNTASIIEDLGFEIDVSICSYMDYSAQEGPNFAHISPLPYFFGKKRKLLELPMTIGYTGFLRKWGVPVQKALARPSIRSLRIGGVFSRANFLERVWLSPEGFSIKQHKKLTRSLLDDGLRTFSFTFHSPSLDINNTPYVASKDDLHNFLRNIEGFLSFFRDEIGGTFTDPFELYQTLVN